MEDPYSKRELDLLHQSIHEKLDSLIEKVTFTNGKVKKITIALAVAFGLIIGVGAENFASVLKILF